MFNSSLAIIALLFFFLNAVVVARDEDSYTNKDHFDHQNRVIKKDVLDPLGNLIHTIYYSYDEDRKKPYSFNITDKENNFIKSYNQKMPWPYLGIFQDNAFNVMIVDSGVDHNHPSLSSKLFYNSFDHANFLDDDNNGLLDDYMGWSLPSNSTLPLESIATNKIYYPLSHGTHVAGIMMKNINNVGLVPYTGDYGEPDFLKLVNIRLKRNDVSFVNMSFSLPHWSTQSITKATYIELQNVIKENSNTLFITASGNDGKRLARNPKIGFGYPALYQFQNIIVVGALNTNDFREEKASFYKRADYSNFDNMNVDIFAPGTKISAPSLGGGEIIHTGTSMASPWVLNLLTKAKLANPEISQAQLKYALLLSAYIPNINTPMKCTSGGMVFPKRFMELSRRFVSNNIFTRSNMIKEAINIQKEKDFNLNIKFSKDRHEKTLTLWQKRIK